jgi:hypothetical protein
MQGSADRGLGGGEADLVPSLTLPYAVVSFYGVLTELQQPEPGPARQSLRRVLEPLDYLSRPIRVDGFPDGRGFWLRQERAT